jgi:hypothetical protein
MLTKFPFDPTGQLQQNKISNELHTVPVANSVDSYLLVPLNTPFYGDNTHSVIGLDGRQLDIGKDYYLTHRWEQACERTGKEVYGSITLVSPKSVGSYYLNYNTIGGEHVDVRANTITEGLVNLSDLQNGAPSIIDWSTAPAAFPTIKHNEHLTSVGGVTEILNVIEKISLAIAARPTDLYLDDVKDLDANYIRPIVTALEVLGNKLEAGARDNAVILDLVKRMNVIAPIYTLDTNLESYEFIVGGVFTVKIGNIHYTNTDIISGGLTDTISLPTPGFPNKCIWANVVLSTNTAINEPFNDRVEITSITKECIEVKYLIERDASMIPVFRGTRVVSYIAIGV